MIKVNDGYQNSVTVAVFLTHVDRQVSPWNRVGFFMINGYVSGSSRRPEKSETLLKTLAPTFETMDPNVKCSRSDAQTWLSTALTNLDTCRAGFLELGVTDIVLPLMSNNVSNLICNTLAINKVPFNYTPPEKDGFPSWVKPGDRKLLQSSTPKDNAVVAKDGSGNFKTIKDAINAASGSGRFVIYVKQGVYTENLEIRKKNVMLRGDGKGRTIITGSRSVGGGTTTFNSATVGTYGYKTTLNDSIFSFMSYIIWVSLRIVACINTPNKIAKLKLIYKKHVTVTAS